MVTVLTEIIRYLIIITRISSLKIQLILPKLGVYLTQYLISSKYEAADETMAKVQDQFQDI